MFLAVPVPAAAEPKPMEQFVPSQSFKFPKNESGRSCVLDWFSKYNWLHYDQSKDSVRCFTCIQASRLGRPGTTRGNEEAFINEGVRNWRKALEKLQKHDCSHFHRESADYVFQVLKRESVAVRLSTQLKQEQQSARIAMRTIISSIRYLTRSGQALQGSTADKGNLMDLLHERALDCPDLANWIKRRDKWVSHDIQDEIIQIMTHQVQRKLISEIKSSSFFGLMADGTTDRTGNEQFSICFRYIESETLQPKEIFMGLYNTDDGTAKTLHKTVSDVMLRSSLPVQNLRGHCFDGAAAMSGHLNGLQKLLSDDQPKSIFVHCSNHSLDLVIQEVAKKCELISNSISLVKDVSNAILESSKRKTIFSDIVLDPCTEGDNSSLKPKRLIALCPTRWCVRAKSIRRFVENYVRVQETLTIMLDNDSSCNITNERRAILRGYQGKMGKFSTLLALNIALAICEPAEQLAKALQSVDYTATGAQQSARTLWNVYNSMAEPDFDRIWSATEKANTDKNMELTMPTMHRVRAPSKRLGQFGVRDAAAVQLSPRESLRQNFISVLDWSKNELERRFEQPGMNRLAQLESLLLNHSKELSVSEVEAELGVHATDFDIESLTLQLKIATKAITQVKTVREYARELANLPKISRVMIDQVERLVVLLLTVPATSTSCERSLSALRRLGTYLRLPMKQSRLTHLAMLHVHRDETFGLNLDEILREFVLKTPERRNVFGIEIVAP